MHIIPLLSSSSCLTDYPSIPTKFFFKWTEFLTTQVGGREAGGLTRFYTGLMSSEPQTACSQPGKKRGPQSGFNPPHDWNWEVIFHMCTAVTVPELDSRYPFFFTSPWTCEKGLMENTIVAFQWLYSTSVGALSVWANVVLLQSLLGFLPPLLLPERDKWQNHVRLVMQRG